MSARNEVGMMFVITELGLRKSHCMANNSLTSSLSVSSSAQPLTNLRLPKNVLLLIALIQGLLLLLLHQSIALKFWPYGQPQWLFSFYSMAVVGPVMLLLALIEGKAKALLQWVVPFTLTCGLLGYYVGSQAIPLAHVQMDNLLFAFVCTLCIATFKILLYAQSRLEGALFNYSALFRFSWRNLFTLGLSLLFALAVWGLLMLWAALFNVINIHFFYDLFTERWFYYPTLALAHGFGIIIFRSQSNIIDIFVRIQHALAKFLLIFLVLVSLLFLAALPFTGLAHLWETGKGSGLILWLQALLLFLVNAVYQDDDRARPYPAVMHRLIYLGVALLPVYSLIAFYGLSLRVAQYGWTVDRCWAFFIAIMLALFTTGYGVAVLVRRDNWLATMQRVNCYLGLTLVGALLLINTPLVDFRKISVASQLQRVEQGSVPLTELDLSYFRYQLARPGYLALQQLKEEVAETHPHLVLRINNLYRNYHTQDMNFERDQFLRAITSPPAETIPDSLADALYEWISTQLWLVDQVQAYQLQRVDLNRDGEDDYVLLLVRNNYLSGYVFYRADDKWENLYLSVKATPETQKALMAQLIVPEIPELEVIEPQWQHLKLGEVLLQVNTRFEE